MDYVTHNDTNFSYVCSVVKEAMNSIVEDTKGMNIIEEVDQDVSIMGLTGDLVEALVAKRFNEKIKAKA